MNRWLNKTETGVKKKKAITVKSTFIMSISDVNKISMVTEIIKLILYLISFFT